MLRSKNFLLAILGLAVVALAAGPVRDLVDVQVTNFPDTQRIKGSVGIEGPIRQINLGPVNIIAIDELFR